MARHRTEEPSPGASPLSEATEVEDAQAGPEKDGQSGDTQGLSDLAEADSETVRGSRSLVLLESIRARLPLRTQSIFGLAKATDRQSLARYHHHLCPRFEAEKTAGRHDPASA